MKRLEVRLALDVDVDVDHAPVVGTLAEQQGRVYFEYADAYLRTGHSLSPLRLPFAPGLFEHTDRDFGPLPGLFDDSLPDGWGLVLMDRHFRRLGRSLAALSPLDRLSWLGTRTMGALTYYPPAITQDVDVDESVFDLHNLAHHSQRILSGEASEVLPQLLRAGGSPGGARPKVLVGYDPLSGKLTSGEADLPPGYEHWLIKFASTPGDTDAGSIELAYALMARAAGIDMPETRLFETTDGDRFFGVKRFDRTGDRRVHVHTFGNLIGADFRIPSSDYTDLLKVTSRLTGNHQDVLRAFRQAVFNVATHNRDDHVKNFAFRLDSETGEWSLTPAYDLTFAEGPGGEHTMTVAGEGRRPGPEHLHRLADRSSISAVDAKAVLDEVRAAVARWDDLAAQTGVSRARRRQIGMRMGIGMGDVLR